MRNSKLTNFAQVLNATLGSGTLATRKFGNTSRAGRFLVGRRSDGARLRRKLTQVSLELRSLRIRGGRAMLAYVTQHLRGHIQYYGVSRNYKRLNGYVQTIQCLLFKWLNLRSQRGS